MNTQQRTEALQPLRQAVAPLSRYGRTSSTLLVADLADGRAGTDVVLALVEVHLAKPDRDPALVAGLQHLLAEDKDAAEGEDTAEDPQTPPDELLCHECGEPFQIDQNEVTTHVDQYGSTDHDLDEDHVPYSLD